MANADASLLVEAMRANALIHKAFHRLFVRATVELVALLVIITAGTMSDFPLAQHVNLVLRIGAIVGFRRKRIVLLVANALSLATERSDAKLGDALVRVATLLFIVNYRQAGAILSIRHESSLTDALVLVAKRVGRMVGTVLVLLARFVSW